tara:strand:- start:1571 stop:2095 length:525 start_codon:yes stop_codon:yes gene_type:complete
MITAHQAKTIIHDFMRPGVRVIDGQKIQQLNRDGAYYLNSTFYQVVIIDARAIDDAEYSHLTKHFEPKTVRLYVDTTGKCLPALKIPKEGWPQSHVFGSAPITPNWKQTHIEVFLIDAADPFSVPALFADIVQSKSANSCGTATDESEQDKTIKGLVEFEESLRRRKSGSFGKR